MPTFSSIRAPIYERHWQRCPCVQCNQSDSTRLRRMLCALGVERFACGAERLGLLGPRRARVHSSAPGRVDTPLARHVMSYVQHAPAERSQWRIGKILEALFKTSDDVVSEKRRGRKEGRKSQVRVRGVSVRRKRLSIQKGKEYSNVVKSVKHRIDIRTFQKPINSM